MYTYIYIYIHIYSYPVALRANPPPCQGLSMVEHRMAHSALPITRRRLAHGSWDIRCGYLYVIDRLQKLFFGVVSRGGALANFHFLLVRGPTNSIAKVAKIVQKAKEDCGNRYEIVENGGTWDANGAEIVENATKWVITGPKSDVGVILC